jgi:hypothetical protein
MKGGEGDNCVRISRAGDQEKNQKSDEFALCNAPKCYVCAIMHIA